MSEHKATINWGGFPLKRLRLRARIPGDVMLSVETVEPRHELGAEREIENRGVLDNPLFPCRFRNCDEALL
jgi:hypothetical protein